MFRSTLSFHALPMFEGLAGLSREACIRYRGGGRWGGEGGMKTETGQLHAASHHACPPPPLTGIETTTERQAQCMVQFLSSPSSLSACRKGNAKCLMQCAKETPHLPPFACHFPMSLPCRHLLSLPHHSKVQACYFREYIYRSLFWEAG